MRFVVANQTARGCLGGGEHAGANAHKHAALLKQALNQAGNMGCRCAAGVAQPQHAFAEMLRACKHVSLTQAPFPVRAWNSS